jgi:hypothetical protein
MTHAVFIYLHWDRLGLLKRFYKVARRLTVFFESNSSKLSLYRATTTELGLLRGLAPLGDIRTEDLECLAQEKSSSSPREIMLRWEVGEGG